MKFQNPSLKYFLNGRTNKRTSPKQYAPHFFKVGGIKIMILLFHFAHSRIYLGCPFIFGVGYI